MSEHRPSKEQLHEHAMNVLESANWMHECGYRTPGQQLEAAAKALTDAARAADEPPAAPSQQRELRWLRALVAEREGHGGDIPVWLALEWIDDAMRRVWRQVPYVDEAMRRVSEPPKETP